MSEWAAMESQTTVQNENRCSYWLWKNKQCNNKTIGYKQWKSDNIKQPNNKYIAYN